MAQKKQERYTERARPSRQQAHAPEGGGRSAGLDPFLIVALLGLAVAVVLALGFLLGRQPAPQTAAEPTSAPTLDPAAAMTDTLPTAPPADAAAEADAAGAGQYPDGPEDQGLDPESTAYFATIETKHGPIVVELWPEAAPQHVNSFVFLARQGYFDGLLWHRVVDGFVIQGGDPTGTGSGGPGYTIPGEFNADNPIPHRAGSLAMARTDDPDSAGSQFYIVTADGPSASNLDGQYTNFGHVISGMGAVLSVVQGDTMDKVTIEEKPIAERVVSPDDVREGNLPDNGLE